MLRYFKRTSFYYLNFSFNITSLYFAWFFRKQFLCTYSVQTNFYFYFYFSRAHSAH